MASELLPLIRRLSAGRLVSALDGCTDGELLARFVQQRDEAAFAAVVARHGSMVRGVCQRVLGSNADADDAFQAAFLVLARKAGSVQWQPSAGPWLYQVALRISRKLRTGNSRRTAREQKASSASHEVLPPDLSWREAQQVLDEELMRLPHRYRAPLILCYLEGKTRDEAARELGWSAGSVKGRLERGRDLLRRRLERRGIGLGGALAGMLLAPAVGQAAPSTVASTLADHAAIFASGSLLSAPEVVKGATLAQGVLQTMFWTKLSTWLCGILVVVGLGLGVAWVGAGALAAPGDGERTAEGKRDPANPPKEGTPRKRDNPNTEHGDNPNANPPEKGDKPNAPKKPRDGEQPKNGDRDQPRVGRPELTGRIVRLDLENRTVTIASGSNANREEKTLPIGPNARVEIDDGRAGVIRDGEPTVYTVGKLGDLARGQTVGIFLNPDGKTVQSFLLTLPRMTLTAKTVDGVKNVFTTQSDAGEQRWELANDAKVYVDGQLSSLGSVKPGTRMVVRLSMDRKYVVSIWATQQRREGDREERE